VPNIKCLSNIPPFCTRFPTDGVSEILVGDFYDTMPTCHAYLLDPCESAKQSVDFHATPDWQFRTCEIPGRSAVTDPQQQVGLVARQLTAAGEERVGSPEPDLRRVCDGGVYSGEALQCLPRHCVEQTGSALQLGVCMDCGNVDALLHFDGVTSGETVSAPCGDRHNGTVRRSCGASGWGALDGNCTLKRCAAETISLLPEVWKWVTTVHPRWPSYEEWASPEWATHQIDTTTLHLDSATAGETVTVRCPSYLQGHSFVGTVNRTCQPDGTWSRCTVFPAVWAVHGGI
jgi:hypothetical protein